MGKSISNNRPMEPRWICISMRLWFPAGMTGGRAQYVESETSAEYFRKVLAENPNATQINLYINSPGGSVMEGYGIYAQLKRTSANVTAYIDGFACSVASVIAMAADTIIMYGNSMMMIHEMLDYVCGNAKQLRKAADDLDKIMEGNIQVYLEKAGGKLEKSKLLAMLEAETWLNGAGVRCASALRMKSATSKWIPQKPLR